MDMQVVSEDEIVKRALAYFHKGYSCAQSVFASFAEYTGMGEELSLKLAAPFGAGIGRMRETCGAFSGLVLFSGFLEGNVTPERDAKGRIYSLVQDLADAFRAEHGTLSCRELLGVAADKGESTRPRERDDSYYLKRPCEQCIATAAALGARLLQEKG